MTRNTKPPQVTVVITTKNRREELHTAITSALAQDAPLDVLVIDDGSSDGTSDMIRAEFPAVRLVQCKQSRGLIVRRNEAARLISTPIIISIDDDAELSSSRVISKTITEFDDDRVGAVAIPFINVRQDEIVRQRAPDANELYITDSYIGTAHAVRRQLFLDLGGYRDFLVHQGEEIDYCLRMLAAGYVVRLGAADPIFHYESPRRDFRRMDFYGRRNDILFSWHNVPMPELFGHLPMSIINGLRSAARVRRYGQMIFGICAGIGRAAISPKNRRPVSRQVYWLHRDLKRNSPVSLANVEFKLKHLLRSSTSAGSIFGLKAHIDRDDSALDLDGKCAIEE